ncbi:serine--pyruvate aminotransferase [Colias croceus]|uniref:serine--pyruvate aminotransferase n=1 Tax=Colias crocea TaxID=72248 RepID=UPI001E27FE4C|nr:serine--pyruvate aminotransferase [Colias croceus]
MLVSPPIIEEREIHEPLFCGPGPCNLLPSVRQALTKPVMSPMCDAYFEAMADIRAGLKYAFQTKSDLVLSISGSGHSGMETVICNLLGPDDTLLIASRGIWDQRAYIMANRYGIKTFKTEVPINATFSFEQIENELKKLKPTALFITHGDSSTGSVQNLDGLGKICHKYGTLLLVDTVVSLGGVPFLMDEWEVDAVYTSTQKALSGPAGIAPVAFSRLAEQKINKRTHEPPFYFDVKLLARQWNCYGDTKEYHHTQSPPMIWALRCCLMELCRETLPKAWARHAATSAHFQKKLQDYGFEFFIPKPEDRLGTVTTVLIPKRCKSEEYLKYIREKHDIIMFGGLGPTAGKVLRIGLMGVNGHVEIATKVANAMADTTRAVMKSSL